MISIIIPIYNVDRYLPTLFDDICKQSYRDFEVILVNDGSTDTSLSLCREFSKEHSHVRIIDKPKGGVSSARNAGLFVAIGEWVTFVDPDDRMHTDYLNTLVHLARPGIDQVLANHRVVDDRGKVLSEVNSFREGVISRSKALSWIVHPVYYWPGYVWAKLYRRSALQGIVYDECLEVNEDTVFSVETLCQCKRVAFTTRCIYDYQQGRPGSLSNTDEGKFTSKSISEILGYNKIVETLMLYHIWNPYIIIFAKWNVYVTFRRNLVRLSFNKTDKKREVNKKLMRMHINILESKFFDLLYYVVHERKRKASRR